MAAIQNDRDLLLQAASPRVVPIPIPMDQIDGLNDALGGINNGLSALGTDVSHLMNNSGDLVIRTTAVSLGSGSTATLTAIRKSGLTGAVTWSVFAGIATLTGTGDARTVAGSSITSASVTIKAAIGSREAYVTISKLGGLATADKVDLTSQVTGQLANGSVSGLGALALLNSIHLNTQTTGALNALTQVNGLGGLAYLSQVQAGTSQVSGFGALAQKDKVSATGDVTGLGGLALQNSVALGSQTTGQLPNGSVSGLGALATQNSVNGATQVTNLGNLAFANAVAANQIGAGQLAAGVVYAGNIYASQVMAGSFTGKEFIGGTFTGTVFRTAASGQRAQMDVTGSNAHQLRIFGADGSETVRLGNSSRNYIRGSTGSDGLELFEIANASGRSIRVSATNGVGLAILTLPGSGNRKPHIVLDAIPSSHPKPDIVTGGIAYHAAHGFIFCDGTGWYKPSAWSAV